MWFTTMNIIFTFLYTDKLLNLDTLLIQLREVACKWESLGKYLNFSSEDIQLMKAKATNDFDCLIELCEHFLKFQGTNCVNYLYHYVEHCCLFWNKWAMNNSRNLFKSVTFEICCLLLLQCDRSPHHHINLCPVRDLLILPVSS